MNKPGKLVTVASFPLAERFGRRGVVAAIFRDPYRDLLKYEDAEICVLVYISPALCQSMVGAL